MNIISTARAFAWEVPAAARPIGYVASEGEVAVEVTVDI